MVNQSTNLIIYIFYCLLNKAWSFTLTIKRTCEDVWHKDIQIYLSLNNLLTLIYLLLKDESFTQILWLTTYQLNIIYFYYNLKITRISISSTDNRIVCLTFIIQPHPLDTGLVRIGLLTYSIFNWPCLISIYCYCIYQHSIGCS